MECNVPMGEGAELDLFPWLRYLGNRTFHRLKELKKEVKDWFDFHYDECLVGLWHLTPKFHTAIWPFLKINT